MAEQTADEARAELERRAWELRVTHCWKTQAIADELGVSRSTVCRMLRQVNERLAAEFREQLEALRVEQTEQHMAIAEQALAAWQRSLQVAETTTVTGGRATVSREGDLVPLPDQVVQQRREQSGNAALLTNALKALAAIRDIWGLNAPRRQDITSAGEPMKTYIGIDVEAV
jgi:hypothetical protein